MSKTASDARVGVIGGGGFGRAVALACARNGREVTIWSRALTTQQLDDPKITVTTNYADFAACELIYVAVPSVHVVDTADQVGRHLDGRHLLVHVSRGLIGAELHPITKVLRTRTPARRVGALAGPLSAQALERGAPGGAIVGTQFPEIGDAVRQSIGGLALRVYQTDDVVGVEVASAMVGLMALVAGYARTAGIPVATLAVLVTRGMFEAARVGVALGARELTFSGLAGFGDLISVVGGDDRPETRLGTALAKGSSLADAGREAGAHIEGVTIARRVADYGARIGLEAPIARMIADVLEGSLTPEGAISRLMSRQVLTE
jgi:glycerol-3-phosphate dehydrogenase (NAD(P)+)